MWFSVFLGFAVGAISSALGIGGGVMLVPVLHLLLGLGVKEAIGTSLAIMVVRSLTATISYSREKLILWRLGLTLEAGSVVGAYLGARTCNLLPSKVIKACFSLLLFFIAFKMWREVKLEEGEGGKPVWMLVALGFISGFLSGVLGIGGGIVNVPIMKLVLGVSMHNAVATSTFIILVTVTIGSITHFMLGNVNTVIWSWMVIPTSIGAYVGAKAAPRVRGSMLSKAFSVLLVLTGLKLLI